MQNKGQGPPDAQNSRGTHVRGNPRKDDGNKPGLGWRFAAVVLGLLVLNWVVAGLLLPDQAERREVPYAPTFLEQVRAGNVERINSEGEALEGTFEQPVSVPDAAEGEGPVERFTTQIPTFADEQELAELLRENEVIINAEPEDEGAGFLVTFLVSFGPVLLLIGLFFFLMRRASGAMGGGGGGPLGQFGKSKARRAEPSKQTVSFEDVAGIDEAKSELEELVDFLRHPEAYRRLGGHIPRGVLLCGQPGTGKTLLARAVAGEADAPFFSISASEFVEAVVGVGASRVRDLFKQAREHAPAIVFIDELDAVGRKRSGGNQISGGNDEREQTLNQILTEMDGFERGDPVIVLGATNRPDDLDDALLRPGRFDRRVIVGAPDKHGRCEILRVHLRNVRTADDVDAEILAQSTPGMVGADLANLCNEAAIAAGRRRADVVTMDDFLSAIEKVALGKPRGIMLSEADRRLTAYHEAGHAVVGMLTPGADPVRKVTIVPRGQALGLTMSTPDEDRVNYRRGELIARLKVALGGRVAEEMCCDDITTGAQNDLEQVAQITRQMVGRWGMSEELGLLAVLPREGENPLASPDGQRSEDVARRLDSATEKIVRELHEEVRELLAEHRDKLQSLTEALLREETLNEDEAYAAAGVEREPARFQPESRSPEAATP